MFLAGDLEYGTALENSLFLKHKPSKMKCQKEIKLSDEEKTATGICWITVYSCDSGNYKTFGFQDFSNPNDFMKSFQQLV